MATRSQILVSDKENVTAAEYLKEYGKENVNTSPSLYKHYDGYPEGVLPVLLPFLYKFNKERGITDTSYLLAQMTHAFISECGGGQMTGFGIETVLLGGVEFVYVIDTPSNQLHVFELDMKERAKEIACYDLSAPLETTMTLAEHLIKNY